MAIATLATFCLQLWLGLWQEVHFGTAAYDLGLFSQEVSAWAHFHVPTSTLDISARHDALGEHFSPILALLGPLWRIFPTPTTLLVAQAVLVASSVPAVMLVAHRRLGQFGAAGFGFAYLFSWPLLALGEYQFHELAFAVPLLAWGLERADAGRWGQATLLMSALLLVKEDMALVAATFAVLLLLAGRRRAALGVVAASLAWFSVVVAVVMPFLARGQSAGYWANSYVDLSATPGALPSALLHHPMRLVKALVVGADTKLETLGACLYTYVGLSFLSPISLLAVPVLLSRFLNTSTGRWGMHFQYNAVLSPILAMAAVDSLVRVKTRYRLSEMRFGQLVAVVAGAVTVVPLLMGTYSPQSTLSDYASLTPTRADRACASIVADADRVIPAADVVEATSYLTPRLVGHLNALYLPFTSPRMPAYLVVQAGPWDVSLPKAELSRWIDQRAPYGYRVVDRSGDCSLLETVQK